MHTLIAFAAGALLGGAVAYGVGWVVGLHAERRGAYDAWAAKLADERAGWCEERARLAALARYERERCARGRMRLVFGDEIPRPSTAGRN